MTKWKHKKTLYLLLVDAHKLTFSVFEYSSEVYQADVLTPFKLLPLPAYSHMGPLLVLFLTVLNKLITSEGATNEALLWK